MKWERYVFKVQITTRLYKYEIDILLLPLEKGIWFKDSAVTSPIPNGWNDNLAQRKISVDLSSQKSQSLKGIGNVPSEISF